jgi:hypothetical protein
VNAKRILRQFLRLRGFQNGVLRRLTNVITTRTPDAGEMRVYALQFTYPYTGIAMIRSERGAGGSVGIGSSATDAAKVCPPGWTFQVAGAESTLPGRVDSFVFGRVSPEVAAVQVAYHDGSVTTAAVGGGYFLAWIRPKAAYSHVMLVARNSLGMTVRRVRIGANGSLPYRANTSAPAQSCA